MRKTIAVFICAFILGWLASKINSISHQTNSSLAWDILVDAAELKNFGINHDQSAKERYCSDLCAARGTLMKINSQLLEVDQNILFTIPESTRKLALEAVAGFEQLPKKDYDCKVI